MSRPHLSVNLMMMQGKRVILLFLLIVFAQTVFGQIENDEKLELLLNMFPDEESYTSLEEALKDPEKVNKLFLIKQKLTNSHRKLQSLGI